MAPQAVYIHIPFCTNKCHYCDFTAYVVKGQPVDDYLSALETEMARTVEQHPPGEIRSVFIGGGTPTVLSPRQMERLCAAIRRYFPRWATDMEFTVEANPGTTEPEKLAAMREGGVNRISFGAQTFRDDLLRRIGRIHTVKDVFRSVEQARQAGFDNLSLDLIFGLPGQTLTDMEETLKTALSLRPDHISAYSLKVEEGTLFHTLYQRGELPLPPEEEEVKMYQLTRRMLDEAGLSQYEISNFAHPGKESRHNLTYWRHEEFYGLGAGAHGYVGGFRHANVRGIWEYIEKTRRGFPTEEVHHVSRAEAMENFMIFGLRVLSGVEAGEFERRFGLPMDRVFGSVLAALQQKGLLIIDGGRVRLTEQGLLFGNEVFAAFLGEAENTSKD
ncbi:oxygen-independent coproporphyrinogen III oxidase [Polycladomyces sp. WAk]|uniref:Heme chaperone HemW n=1 Tax=Polycladomyces zharkentensis TaxID=2807616 RepID=A0ABS2WG81_9BACL|nr:oxygen-independent coproporphyrinogen III oxidase [Polycladomyces sp. WAk]